MPFDCGILDSSTVGLLEPSPCTATTKLLGLAAPGVSDKKGSVIPDEDILDLLLALLVDVLLVVCNEGLGYALADGVDLGSVAPTLDTDPHIDTGETVPSQQEYRFVRLEPRDLRLHQLYRAPVDLDQPAFPTCSRSPLLPSSCARSTAPTPMDRSPLLP